MKLKKMMMSGLCACLMLGTLAGCGSAQGDDAQSEDPTVILVGVSPDYPPYESLDSDGNIVGFDADMLVELEKYMTEDGGNYDLQFRQMEFNAILSQLPAKQLDMAISGFTYDEERKVAWSDPYTATAQVAVMPKDTEITSVDDLKGKTIAAQTASTGEKAANEIEDANVQSISDVKVIFSGLASGQYDAAVVDLAVAKNYVDSGDYVMLDETLMDEKNYIITYEGNDELLEKVNAALKKFMASDRYVELCDQYGVKALEE